MTGAEYRKKLQAVWVHASPIHGPIINMPWRYVPRALRPALDHSWGVFDRKTNKFVDSSLADIPIEVLANETLKGALN